MIILWPRFSCVCQWKAWKWTAFRGFRDILTKALIWLTSINWLPQKILQSSFKLTCGSGFYPGHLSCSAFTLKTKKMHSAKVFLRASDNHGRLSLPSTMTKDTWKNKYSAKDIILTACRLSSRILSTGLTSSFSIQFMENSVTLPSKASLL